MPAKNIIKNYLENGYYHLYNRGVEKRDIFLEEQDCKVFLHYLKMYLLPPEQLKEQKQPGLRTYRFIPLNLSKELDLLAFCLMPNHIHLLVKQYTKNAITKFMRRLITGYVMYFNKKYQRVGTLFQNIYKGVLVESEDFLLHLSRYIHLNPTSINPKTTVDFLDFSSYPYYLRLKNANWLKPDEILTYFKDVQNSDFKDFLSYKSFIEDYTENPNQVLANLTLEEDDQI